MHLKNGAEYTLVASIVKQKIGKKIIRRFAYNGSIPGPTIEVEQGAKIKVKFINQTDVPQTIHPHGLRLDYHNDGIPGISQPTDVKPGESYEYELSFPDVGVFWYHPHVREDYTQQMGLYGNFIVTPLNKMTLDPFNQKISLTLNDLLLGKEAAPFYKNYTNYAAMGRYGNVMMMNGSEHFSMKANEGDVVRFYMTNVANTRTFRFQIPHAKMKLIAGDLSSFEQEMWTDSVTIAPGERNIVDVYFPKKGKYEIFNSTPEKTTSLGFVTVSSAHSKTSFQKEFFILHSNKALSDEINKLKSSFSKPVDKNLILSVQMQMNHKSDDESQKIEWEDPMPEMNAMMTSKDVVWKLIDGDTKKENMDIQWLFEKDHMYKIRIFNDPNSAHPMQHPIHFHGQRFLILSRNGVNTTNYVWKDTVLVPRGDTVNILLETSNPGDWMAHCHISEHLSSGMGLGFRVVDTLP